MAVELGLKEGSLTGTWDYSHSLKIIWNGLKKNPTVEDLINLVFSAMDEYRTGKSNTIFRAKAAELRLNLAEQEEANNKVCQVFRGRLAGVPKKPAHSDQCVRREVQGGSSGKQNQRGY